MIVTTLVEDHELHQLRVPDLGREVGRAGMRWAHLPIPDLQAPGAEFTRRWKTWSPELHKGLSEGGRVLLRCRGGLGRTGAGRCAAAHRVRLVGGGGHSACETSPGRGHRDPGTRAVSCPRGRLGWLWPVV